MKTEVNETANWYDRHVPTRFIKFAQGIESPPLLDIILEERSGRYGRGWLIDGQIATGKSSLMRVIACSRYCTARTGVEPCGACDSCTAIRKGGGDWYGHFTQVNLSDHNWKNDLASRIGIMAEWGKPPRADVPIHTIAMDEFQDVQRPEQLWISGTMDRYPTLSWLIVSSDRSEIIPEIRSRLQRAVMKAPTPEQVQQWLPGILEQEHVVCDEAAIREIAKRSNYAPRDILKHCQGLSRRKNHFTHELVVEYFKDQK